jgi:hypothetical protein
MRRGGHSAVGTSEASLSHSSRPYRVRSCPRMPSGQRPDPRTSSDRAAAVPMREVVRGTVVSAADPVLFKGLRHGLAGPRGRRGGARRGGWVLPDSRRAAQYRSTGRWIAAAAGPSLSGSPGTTSDMSGR